MLYANYNSIKITLSIKHIKNKSLIHLLTNYKKGSRTTTWREMSLFSQKVSYAWEKLGSERAWDLYEQRFNGSSFPRYLPILSVVFTREWTINKYSISYGNLMKYYNATSSKKLPLENI